MSGPPSSPALAGVTPTLFGTVGDVPVWAWSEPDGRSALRRWQRLTAEAPATGLWPFLVPDERLAEELGEYPEDDSVAKAHALDGRALLREQIDAELRTWPDSPLHQPVTLPPTSAIGPGHIGDGSRCGRTVALVRASAAWEIPAVLSWVASDSDGPPSHHSAVLRHFAAAYGVTLLSLGGDYMDLLVDRPPTTAPDVLEAGRELYAYCPDVLVSGELPEVIAGQVAARSWNLWWD